ncbi:hypothetical protein F4677DRAFT_444443 [Hypoxylon crocopeplum]|nr:hypothetical protein F4677DRAFT_444443 [Hypoxylon crocopeplum]
MGKAIDHLCAQVIPAKGSRERPIILEDYEVESVTPRGHSSRPVGSYQGNADVHNVQDDEYESSPIYAPTARSLARRRALAKRAEHSALSKEKTRDKPPTTSAPGLPSAPQDEAAIKAKLRADLLRFWPKEERRYHVDGDFTGRDSITVNNEPESQKKRKYTEDQPKYRPRAMDHLMARLSDYDTSDRDRQPSGSAAGRKTKKI